MGQYWQIYNETKHEKMNPWDFGEVAKLHEWPMDGPGGMQTALIILLLEKSSLGEGGGDFNFEAASEGLKGYVGSWRGDRVSIVGDYSGLPEFGGYDNDEQENPPQEDFDSTYRDISKHMVELMSYEPALASQGLCGAMVTPEHKWQDRQYKPWDKDMPDTRKPTLASANGWDGEEEISLAPDMVFHASK